MGIARRIDTAEAGDDTDPDLESPGPDRDTADPAKAVSTQTRLSVNVNPSTAAAIRAYTEATGVTLTEAVRRLVAYGNVVFQADRAGKKVLLKDGGEIERLLIVD